MDKKVVIYSMPMCGYCNQAKEFLTKKGIEYIEHDVSKDKSAYEEMRRISSGARSVPVISVCDEVMIGFDTQKLEQMLKCLE